jgi:hypothetical protein
VFEYVGSGGSDGALNLLGGNATDVRDCKVVSTNDFCASVNNFDGAAVPWLYKNKSGQTSFGHGEFYEGGLNLNFLGLQNECFSSFLAETRSSQSTTATLKDFVLGSFQQCGATMTTTPHASTTTIGGNGTATISDDATVTVSGGSTPPAPTGSVSFFYCYSATPITACTASGTSAGSVNLSGATKNGNDYTVSSGNITVHAAGTYCWFSSWPGDSNYHPPAGSTVISHDGPDECVTIGPLQPALHTTQSATGEVTPGSSVHDTVTFDTPPATPSNGTFGTVTFKLYGPFDSSPSSCGALTGTTVNTVTINGTDTSYDSNAVAPTTPGWYAFTASYAPASGDANNLAVPETSCGATGEQFHVRQFNPSLTTAQTVVISDSATISNGGGGGNLNGTAHFRAFSDSGCTAGNELTAQQDVAVGGGTSVTVSTTSSVTFNTAGAHTVYWQVSYTSNNSAQTDIAASCTENTNLTITN